MTRNRIIGALAIATTLVTGFAATPAMARHGHGYDRGYDDRGYYENRGYNDYRRDRRDRDYRGYRSSRCDKGTGGTIIGAVAGGLAGREIARRGNRTEGAIIGAAVGALAGRAIDKSDSNCNRRYR